MPRKNLPICVLSDEQRKRTKTLSISMNAFVHERLMNREDVDITGLLPEDDAKTAFFLSMHNFDTVCTDYLVNARYDGGILPRLDSHIYCKILKRIALMKKMTDPEYDANDPPFLHYLREDLLEKPQKKILGISRKSSKPK